MRMPELLDLAIRHDFQPGLKVSRNHSESIRSRVLIESRIVRLDAYVAARILACGFRAHNQAENITDAMIDLA